MKTKPIVITITRDERVYKPFEGSNAKQMQRLLTGQENGIQVDHTRLPISPRQLAEARLGRIESQDDTNFLKSVYVNTSIAVLPNPNGEEVKFVNEHPLIYTLTPETKLVGYNLPITQEQYDQSKGFDLNQEQASAFRNNNYALPNVRRQFWEECAAQGDIQLAKDYIEDVEKTTGMTFDNIMGMLVPQSKGLRLFGVGRIDFIVRSLASGYNGLGVNLGRLVGVAAEPQVVAKKIEDAKVYLENRL